MSIVAVERALVILKLLSRSPEGLGVRPLSRELGYSPAVAQKSLQALVAQGYAVKNTERQVYQLGPEAVALGLIALDGLDVRRLARPILKNLAEVTEETALLGVSRGDIAVYIDHVPSQHDVRMSIAVGDPRPFNCTAIGKVLLSEESQGSVARIAAAGAFKTPTEYSISDLDEVTEMLAIVREQGYAIDEEEYSVGARCVAVPVRNFDGEIVAAVAVAGPTDRVTTNEPQIIQEVLSAAKAISRELGASDSSNRSSPRNEGQHRNGG